MRVYIPAVNIFNSVIPLFVVKETREVDGQNKIFKEGRGS